MPEETREDTGAIGLALEVAAGLKRGLLRGSQRDYDWMFTEEFELWVQAWADAVGLDSDPDPALLRGKLIETCWRPKA